MKRRNIETSNRRNEMRRREPRATVSDFRKLDRDEDGSVMLEHALLLAAFTLPMYLVLGAGIRAIGTYYGMLTFFGSIPFF